MAGTALGVLLTGCTINIGTSETNPHSSMMGQGTFSGMDIMFAQMMIPHHQQAVDMGTLAETRAENPLVKELAARIKAEQAPEIEQMKGWLESANAPLDMGHEMGMDGMLSDEDMARLESSTGAEFDRLYVEGMIEHHRGAIQMAEMIEGSDNDEARALAEAIISSQTQQIEELQLLLEQLQ